MQIIEACKTILEGEKVLELSQNLTLAFKRLRVAQAACESCPVRGVCTPMLNLTLKINFAITELTEEWNLAQ